MRATMIMTVDTMLFAHENGLGFDTLKNALYPEYAGEKNWKAHARTAACLDVHSI